jgi:hypothetical protein
VKALRAKNGQILVIFFTSKMYKINTLTGANNRSPTGEVLVLPRVSGVSGVPIDVNVAQSLSFRLQAVMLFNAVVFEPVISIEA